MVRGYTAPAPPWLLRKGDVCHRRRAWALQDQPRTGTIRTPDSRTYDLRYARHVPSENGGTQMVLVTDRNISFFEAASAARTADYPFMVIELRLNPSGEGEGKITVATKITANPANNHIVLENYGSQPLQLTRVREVEQDK